MNLECSASVSNVTMDRCVGDLIVNSPEGILWAAFVGVTIGFIITLLIKKYKRKKDA